MPESDDQALIDALAAGGPAAWQAFLDACSETVFRAVSLFASTYDERMDLFLFVCTKLHDDDMRRLRSFRFRPESPCRFSTWLAVVVKNLAVDHARAQEGRFRPFRKIDAMEQIDRLVFDYHLKDGKPLEEVRHLLVSRHGLDVGDAELADRAARVEAALSANQRWRLMARLSERRHHLPLDPVSGAAGMEPEQAIALVDSRGDPERALRVSEAGQALHSAMESIPPRERLAVTLRYRDGMSARETAVVLQVTAAEAEQLAQDGASKVRERLKRAGIAPPDFEEVLAVPGAAMVADP
jgi:RNA polymerase sigma factor (sigma-70 family)